ncbi:MAG: alcohol dehydrogenase catalytic domain-containing protein [Anaerolineae bacterium]
MTTYPNRSAYVKAPWQFEVRDNPVAPPAAGQLLVEVKACGICGTDQHIADRFAPDWEPFGHESAGIVKAVGEGVTRFKVGDRVALDSSAPCGVCDNCAPPPHGRGRPDLCPNPVSYMATAAMGFGQFILAPQQSAVFVPDSMSMDVAALVEPLGVCLDLVQVAQVGAGDHVLVVGPGPLGLGAVFFAKHAGAEKIYLAGRSNSQARMTAGLALGADTLIEVDKKPLTEYDFGKRKPDKILVTAQPDVLPSAIAVAALGGIISYIGVAWNATKDVQFDADYLHFNKLSIRPSHAWPGTHAAESMRWLTIEPILGKTLVTHHFGLEEIEKAMLAARDDRAHVIKPVVMPNA